MLAWGGVLIAGPCIRYRKLPAGDRARWVWNVRSSRRRSRPVRALDAVSEERDQCGPSGMPRQGDAAPRAFIMESPIGLRRPRRHHATPRLA